MCLRACDAQNPQSVLTQFERIRDTHPTSSIAQYNYAKALDHLADLNRSNQLLLRAINEYQKYLEMGQLLSDIEFKTAAERCIERMRFIGNVKQFECFHSKIKVICYC